MRAVQSSEGFSMNLLNPMIWYLRALHAATWSHSMLVFETKFHGLQLPMLQQPSWASKDILLN